MRLRSLLRPRLGVERGKVLPSGDATDTDGEGEGRASNIGGVGSTLVAAAKVFVLF